MRLVVWQLTTHQHIIPPRPNIRMQWYCTCMVWYGVVCCVDRCGMVWCGAVWCGAVWCGAVWCVRSGVVWCGAVWCGVVWCGVVHIKDKMTLLEH